MLFKYWLHSAIAFMFCDNFRFPKKDLSRSILTETNGITVIEPRKRPSK